MTGLKELVRRFTVVTITTTTAVLGLIPPLSASETTPELPSGTYLGAYVQPDGWSKGEVMSAVTELEADLGRTLDISHLFYTWNGNFPNWKEAWDIQNGRIPMVSWRGTALDPVLNGSQDTLIRAKADGLKALGSRVLLRWFGEMDAVVWEDEIGTPARFVQAWQRIHDIFESRGATNVEWVWCPNASAFGSGKAQAYYPGDAYVDWICGDGYNWAPGRQGSPWTSFQNVFSSFYAWGSATGKPLLIGETGVQERDPGEKGSWITGMANAIKSTYPAIKALVYFDAASSSNQGGWYDWHVDTSTASYDAFRAMAADPYFNSAGGGGGPDATPPTVPQALQGAAPGDTRIDLQWSPSTDNIGLAGYDVVRNGTLVASVEQTTFVDTTVAPGTTYSYHVRARDLAGNTSAESAPVSVTTPSGSPSVVFADNFEAGNLSQWTTRGTIAVQGQMGFNGTKGARAQGSGTPAYATHAIAAQAELYDGFRFNIAAQGGTSLYLARLRTAAGAGIASLYVRGDRRLSVFVDAGGGTSKISSVIVSRNAWHSAQLHVRVAGSSSLIEVWLDGTKVGALTVSANLGSSPIGQLQIGENVSGRTFDVRFDDVAVGTAYLPI